MHRGIQLLGFILALQGVSGAVDHLWGQPFIGIFLNAFNRLVIPRIDWLTGYELYANLALTLIGIAAMVAADAVRRS
ncbi:hypothetical protein [Spongiactinospora sp. TRM90649]|uniref:hypothetical protein n=1 Tax=Spongiactinospora sp. TRM90649 TaxID=3031114 RepID=UPI0023F67D89|nr:hypothetical protein [Spongiactinospora sp. TRM90649]MDF5753948.1 hypothetical protein [Spongiactinospora sp. TRM90649]